MEGSSEWDRAKERRDQSLVIIEIGQLLTFHECLLPRAVPDASLVSITFPLLQIQEADLISHAHLAGLANAGTGVQGRPPPRTEMPFDDADVWTQETLEACVALEQRRSVLLDQSSPTLLARHLANIDHVHLTMRMPALWPSTTACGHFYISLYTSPLLFLFNII